MSDFELVAANAATEETQQARYRALNGKKMLFVSGNYLYPSIAGALCELLIELKSYGCHVTGVYQSGLKEDGYFETADARSVHDEKIFADFCGGEPKLAAQSVFDELCKLGIEGDFDGVYSPHESCQPILGRLNELMGIKGNTYRGYEMARDKYLTRKCLIDAGLNTAKAQQMWSVDDIEKAIDHVGFPMIIKPTVGMGSQGVYRADNEEQLRTQTARLFADIDNDWMLAASKLGEQAPVLAETFIEPIKYGGIVTEFDIDILFWEGEPVYANVVDNWEPEAPYFQDRGFNCPSITPAEVQKEMIDYCIACVKAFGFVRGNFHMECWNTKSGPILIECNPRVGGGSINAIHQNVYGQQPSVNMALAMMGVPINPPRSETPLSCYGFALIGAHKTGQLEQVNYLDDIKENEMVFSTINMKKAGDKVRGLDTGVPDWLAQVDMKTSPDNLDKMMKFMQETFDKTIAAASANTLSIPKRRKSSVDQAIAMQ